LNQESRRREKEWKRKTTFQAGRNKWMLVESEYSELRLRTAGKEVSNVTFGIRPESVPFWRGTRCNLKRKNQGRYMYITVVTII